MKVKFLALAIIASLLTMLSGLTAPAVASPPFGSALQLDGVDDYASVGDAPTLDLGTAGQSFTVEAWMYVPDETSDAVQVIAYKQYGYRLSVNFNPTGNDVLILGVWGAPLGSGDQILAQIPITSGWHHIAGTFDNTSGSDTLALLLDGSQVFASSAASYSPGLYNSGSALSIGANSGAASFDGWLDEVRLSDTVRYAGTYTVPAGPFADDASTRALWHFEEACGASFADSSGNGHTLSGFNGVSTGSPSASEVSLQFSSPTYSSTETVASKTVTVTRTGNLQPTVGADYQTGDGTATQGSDYTAASGSVSLGCGVASATFPVPILPDSTYEGSETVQLALSTPTGGAVLGLDDTAVLTITDQEDQPTQRFVAATSSVKENVGSASLQVVRTGDASAEASVGYALTGGTATQGGDFSLVSGTLDFAVGVTSASILIPIVNDGAPEAAETIQVALSGPSGAVLGGPSSHVVTIAASDQRPDGWISRSASSGYVGNNVFNSTGAGQTKLVNAGRGQKRVFYVRVYNDGNVTNKFAIRGTGSPAGATVRYFAGTSSTNITSALRSTGGYLRSLAPGTFQLVRIEITVGLRAPGGSTKSAAVSGTWTGDSTRVDVVMAKVKVVA